VLIIQAQKRTTLTCVSEMFNRETITFNVDSYCFYLAITSTCLYVQRVVLVLFKGSF